jgi:hypothetical protein
MHAQPAGQSVASVAVVQLGAGFAAPLEGVHQNPPPSRVTQTQSLAVGDPHVGAEETSQTSGPPDEQTEQAPHTPALQHWLAVQHVLPHTFPPPVQPTALPLPLHMDAAARAHAMPALQQALPQGVVPAGQPQVLVAALTQATPFLQQHWLQGVVPGAHGVWLTVVAPEQTTPSPA